MKVLAWDIETEPILAHTWNLWPKQITVEKVVKPSRVMCFAAKWVGTPGVKFYSTFHHGQQKMLDAAWSLLNDADALLSWNGKGFDTKHMSREFLLAGMPPPSPAKEIDLMLAVRKRFAFDSSKLQYVSEQLGLEGKVQHSGFDLWIRCMAGDKRAWAQMRTYNKRDVTLLEDAFERLRPWIHNMPNVALYEGTDGCPACGSGNLVREGFAYTAAGRFQRYHCADCGKWSRSAKREDTTALREVA